MRKTHIKKNNDGYPEVFITPSSLKTEFEKALYTKNLCTFFKEHFINFNSNKSHDSDDLSETVTNLSSCFPHLNNVAKKVS